MHKYERANQAEVPLDRARRYLEPGPVVLVSSEYEGERNLMTMGWHMILSFTPSLFGCLISAGNHSFELVRKSRECVINVPTTALTDEVVGIGNSSGREIDKFTHFNLTPEPSDKIATPGVRECYANFECRLLDDSMIERHNFFLFEIVAGRAATTPEYPETLHYTGDGVFMVAGEIIDRHQQFLPQML
ncbi:flavin reductase family protein [Halomonas alkaliantarctica]|nr:flavin reductase family protein [Halomonas alkaliantarctica]